MGFNLSSFLIVFIFLLVIGVTANVSGNVEKPTHLYSSLC
jgi:hypothetical protein